jgi:hypothetical protein
VGSMTAMKAIPSLTFYCRSSSDMRLYLAQKMISVDARAKGKQGPNSRTAPNRSAILFSYVSKSIMTEVVKQARTSACRYIYRLAWQHTFGAGVFGKVDSFLMTVTGKIQNYKMRECSMRE